MKIIFIFGLIMNMFSNLAIALLFLEIESNFRHSHFGFVLFLCICLSLVIPSLYLASRGELFKEKEDSLNEVS